MKTIAHFLSFLCIMITFSCKKDNLTNSDNNKNRGFDIDISKHKYYNEEIFPEQYFAIYDKWKLNGISGGFAGAGYTPDFEQLLIEEIGIFKIYRKDSLILYGKIEIEQQDEKGLLISFIEDSTIGNIFFFDMIKYVHLSDSSLTLYAPCCDRFNYHFTRKYFI